MLVPTVNDEASRKEMENLQGVWTTVFSKSMGRLYPIRQGSRVSAFKTTPQSGLSLVIYKRDTKNQSRLHA